MNTFEWSAFSERNRLRCESSRGFSHALNSWSTSDWYTALIGELGEAGNIVKKLNRVRDGISGNKQGERTESELLEKLAAELADGFIYLDLLAQSLGIDLGAAVLNKFDTKSREIGYEE